MNSLEFLLEYDRGKTAAAYGQKLLDVAVQDQWFVAQYKNALPGQDIRQAVKTNPEKVLDYLFTWIERGDPTPHKEYSQAIAKLYAQGQSKLEDIASTLVDYLAKFDKLKRRKKIQPPRNDFNRYRSIEDFYDVVDEYPDEEAEKAPEVKQNATELYRDANWIVTVPNDVEAACYYGQGTRWCTAGKNNNMYSYYTKGDRPLYIIIPRKPAYPNEKYQFHFETGQFMNEQDRQIGEEGVKKLIARFPQLPKVLEKPVLQSMGTRMNDVIATLLPAEYKQTVIDSTPAVAKSVIQMVEEYADRITAFGWKSLTSYGVELPDAVKADVSSGMRDYFAQCMKGSKNVWRRIQDAPELARNEDRIEALFSSDATLQDIANASPVTAKLKQALAATGQKIHKDALNHIVELVIRDPLFRFCMKQTAKLYTAKLAEAGYAIQ